MGLIEEFIEKYPEEMAEAQMRRKAVKKLLADYDKTLREQIAREIKKLPRFDLVDYDGETGETPDGCWYDVDDVIAAIAGGK